MSKPSSGSCSSRVVTNNDARDTDVEINDIEEKYKKRNPDSSGDTTVNELDISEETLTDEKNSLLAVRSERTEKDKAIEPAEEFLLTRESVVRFVQDSIANAVDRQKRNADKHGRANDLSFKVNDLVLLSTVNLPKRVVTNVGSNKLLPKFIGPFRVLHRRGNAYTIELPRKMRTHPTFYVGRLRPYHQFAVSSADESDHPFQESLKDSCGREPGSHVEPADYHGGSGDLRTHDELTTARHEERDSCARTPTSSTHSSNGLPTVRRSDSAPSAPTHDGDHARGSHHLPKNGDDPQVPRALSEVPTHRSEQIFPPPPPPLVDSHGGQRFLVERIHNHRDVKGHRTSYLVRWRGYPPSHDSWEPRSQLLVDVEGLVRQYDETHPMG